MVGGSGVLVATLLHHVATSALAVNAAAAEASLAHSLAGSSVQRVDATLHNHAEKKAATAVHLRGQSHSSHGLRSNVFRAAAATSARSRARLHQMPGAVPLYVPKMGLANVTEPTAFPPPPPVLHPWRDMQPIDTAVGNYIISGFIAQPTVTPPPSQSSLDLAFACPALLTWPSEVSVSSPYLCTSQDSGNWSDPGGGQLIKWVTSCIDTTSPGLAQPSVAPVTTYTVPNGDLFGTSQERQTMFGKTIELRDCGGAIVYTVQEKIYKQAGQADPDACAKYRSCDGVLYFQYFIKDLAGRDIAMTPYTTIFQDSFDITDSAGGLIAQVNRNGWAPHEKADCSGDVKPHMWHLKYASSPPGPWAVVTAQWPIAAMMTMLAQRDESRQPNGSVLWSNCEVLKSTGYVVLVGTMLCCCVCIPMAIFLVCSAPILRFLAEAETRVLPKRMGKPGNYN